jgi:hypothetical protein
VASYNTIHPLAHVGGAQRKIVLNTNARLVKVINAYEALELAAKARLSEVASMRIEWEKLRQDCAKGTTTVNELSEALALLQPDETYLLHGTMAKELLDKELALTCSVRSHLWLMLSTYLIPIEPVS